MYTENVRNITISLDESTLERARRYAANNGIGLNELIRKLLNQALEPQQNAWLEEMFDLADQNGWRSDGPWSREDAYDSKRIC